MGGWWEEKQLPSTLPDDNKLFSIVHVRPTFIWWVWLSTSLKAELLLTCYGFIYGLNKPEEPALRSESTKLNGGNSLRRDFVLIQVVYSTVSSVCEMVVFIGVGVQPEYCKLRDILGLTKCY